MTSQAQTPRRSKVTTTPATQEDRKRALDGDAVVNGGSAPTPPPGRRHRSERTSTGCAATSVRRTPGARRSSQTRWPRRRWASSCPWQPDRKSTRLNSSHGYISYAVFCLKKKKKRRERIRTDDRPEPSH